MQQPNNLVIWLPILGALIALVSSLITTWLNNRNYNLRNKEERDRKRLEEAYEALIGILSVYSKLTGQLIGYIHHNDKIQIEDDGKISPLVKFEMIVSLYFPEMINSWEQLKKTKEEFGKQLSDIISENYLNKELIIKQNKSALIWDIYTKLIDDTDIAKNKIKEIIKP